MFLSGLNNIDFSGIGSISGALSRTDLFSRFRSSLSSGVTDGEINSILDRTLASNDLVSAKIPDDIANQVSDGVTSIIIDVLGGGGFGSSISGRARALSEKGNIDAVVAQLTREGYALVPKGYAIKQQSPSPASTPVKSELVDPNNIAAAGALAVGRTGTSSPSSTPAPSAVPGSLNDTIQSGIKSIMAAWPKSAPAGPTQYIHAPHTQTIAEKKRLTLIISGFGVMFVLAIGIIAARNND